MARVASALAVEIDTLRLGRARRKALASLEVYDCWLRGLDALRQGTPEDDVRGRAFFERALELDPAYARAHAGLSLSHFNEWSCQLWEQLGRQGASRVRARGTRGGARRRRRSRPDGARRASASSVASSTMPSVSSSARSRSARTTPTCSRRLACTARSSATRRALSSWRARRCGSIRATPSGTWSLPRSRSSFSGATTRRAKWPPRAPRADGRRAGVPRCRRGARR